MGTWRELELGQSVCCSHHSIKVRQASPMDDKSERKALVRENICMALKDPARLLTTCKGQKNALLGKLDNTLVG